jgi:hypothetical protein
LHDIVTERLVLRLLQAEDVLAFAVYRSDPAVARYQSWDTSYTTADGESLVASQQGVDSAILGRGCTWPPSTVPLQHFAATAQCAS